MSRLIWDNVSERLYETGVDRGVIYPQAADGSYPKGAAWNGLSNVTLSPSGAEPTALYANNRKYLNLMSAEELGGSIEAYTYPDEFAECDGSKDLKPGVRIGQQKRKPFGFCFRTLLGNDTEGTNHGYKIHIVYGCMATPSESSYATVNDSPEARTMSWDFTTTPVEVSGYDSTASVEVDSTTVDAAKLAALEAVLYGSAETEARLPLPAEVAQIISGETGEAQG